jgi:hypothetical protein
VATKSWSAHSLRLEAVAEGVPLFNPSVMASRSLAAATALAAALEGDGPLPPEPDFAGDGGAAGFDGADGGGGDAAAAEAGMGGVDSKVHGWLADTQPGLRPATFDAAAASVAGAGGSSGSGGTTPPGAAAAASAATPTGRPRAGMMRVPASCSAPNPLARTVMLPATAALAYPMHPAATAAGNYPQNGVALGLNSANQLGLMPGVPAGGGLGAGEGAGGGGAPAAGGGTPASGGLAAGAREEGNGGRGEDEFINISLAQVIPAEELTLIERIGQGAEGRVFLGRWNHIEVAAKEFFTGNEGGGGDAASEGDGQMKAHVSSLVGVFRGSDGFWIFEMSFSECVFNRINQPTSHPTTKTTTSKPPGGRFGGGQEAHHPHDAPQRGPLLRRLPAAAAGGDGVLLERITLPDAGAGAEAAGLPLQQPEGGRLIHQTPLPPN